uniref:Uncharacterized protein n=1 Tax=Strombidium rassoulzadegani TaxID=1082188 RepID=A0A7S3CT15_9SPIT|mmetsp:Transcript_7492/g.12656  ORF Transcript_7492/g.12656 Transcript_7492/m.12656 type:complete len:116 (+) Transcript_7492:419-766(+)
MNRSLVQNSRWNASILSQQRLSHPEEELDNLEFAFAQRHNFDPIISNEFPDFNSSFNRKPAHQQKQGRFCCSLASSDRPKSFKLVERNANNRFEGNAEDSRALAKLEDDEQKCWR